MSTLCAGGIRSEMSRCDLKPSLSRYAGKATEQLLATAEYAPSVGGVGDSNDNALAETVNGPFKAEVIHRRWPWRSFDAVECATLKRADWFNNRRLLKPIGTTPPAEAEGPDRPG